MKYGIYKNTDQTPDVAPFTTIEGDLRFREGAYGFFLTTYSDKLLAVYPMSAFYVVVLED